MAWTVITLKINKNMKVELLNKDESYTNDGLHYVINKRNSLVSVFQYLEF